VKHFEIPWSFYFQFDQKTQMMRLQLSEMFKQKESMPNNYYVLSYEDVITLLHKYDHRKLNYFFDNQMKDTFDMVIRIKNLNKKKGYIKTHAVCYIKDETMHCLSINYLDVIETKKKLDQLISTNDVVIDIDNLQGQIFKKDLKIDVIERHLYQMIYRTYSI